MRSEKSTESRSRYVSSSRQSEGSKGRGALPCGKLIIQLAAKVTHLSTTWRSVQIVRTREKVCTYTQSSVPTRSTCSTGTDLQPSYSESCPSLSLVSYMVLPLNGYLLPTLLNPLSTYLPEHGSTSASSSTTSYSSESH
jgi:hypothetical protein